MSVRIKHLVIAITAVLAVFAATASGAARVHKYTSALSSVTVSTGNGYPNPGGVAVLAGTLRLSGYGAGALVDHVKITGHPQPNVFEFAGTEVDYLALGTWRSSLTGKSTVQPDGSQQVVVSGRFTGGTGLYKRSKGTFKFTGTVPAGSTVLTGHSTGSLTY
jgi:hypothetical protein